MTKANAETERKDTVWQRDSEVERFLQGRKGLPFSSEQIDIMLRMVAASGQDVRRVLDLGCGAGAMSVGFMIRYPAATAVLVDFSEPMLAAAREALAELTSRLNFHDADLLQPAWQECLADDARFDVVVSGFAIHHLPDERKHALYAEVFERLEPGGWFFNMEHVSSPSPWLEEQFWEYLTDSIYHHHQAIGTPRPREEIHAEHAGNVDARGANILQAVDEQCRWLRDIGFVDADCYFKIFEIALFGGRKPSA